METTTKTVALLMGGRKPLLPVGAQGALPYLPPKQSSSEKVKLGRRSRADRPGGRLVVLTGAAGRCEERVGVRRPGFSPGPAAD